MISKIRFEIYESSDSMCTVWQIVIEEMRGMPLQDVIQRAFGVK